MCNVVIWGAGLYAGTVLEAIRTDKCRVVGIVDSNRKLCGTLYKGSIPISLPEELLDGTIDYVVISVMQCGSILTQCRQLGISEEKIIPYWESDQVYEFLDANVKKIFRLEKEVTRLQSHLNNLPYELGLKQTPLMRSAEELLELILTEKKSLCRFGDGELEIMQKRERAWFQNVDEDLSRRLGEVFDSNEEQVIIALADDFGCLDAYTKECQDAIREYLDHGIREKLEELFQPNRVYYDAYVTRPYYMYRDKRHAERIFALFRRVFGNRNLFLVEGEQSCIGARNDLFMGARRIRRLIAPSQNAYSVYQEILCGVRQSVAPDDLVLISLGPTATVLAYDLAMEGLQALDIGQLDNEYEWYLRGAKDRVDIPGKCVAELGKYHRVQEIEDKNYQNQIVARIGLETE